LRALSIDDRHEVIMDNHQSLPLVHWGLDRWPFRSVPRADQLYPTAALTEALARMEYLVESRRRLGVLLGEPGMGKSLLLTAAARQLGRQGKAVALVDATGVTPRELAWQVAGGLKASPGEDDDTARLWRRITDRIIENRLQQFHTVLLVDEAGLAGPDVLTQLARLTRLDTAAAARWTIVLAAEPEQAARWSATIRDLVDLRIEMVAWSAEETVGYVQMALVEAGRIEPLFDEDALAAIYRLTRGVARQVARLAGFALLAGAGARQTTIDAATVEAAYEEISWPAEVGVY
jgi:type II secretory pathway predicted ATPase ExeA